MIYTCQVWGQNQAKIKQISELQDKALRIINFKPKNYPVSELYKSNEILKLTDYIKLLNCSVCLLKIARYTICLNQIPIFNNFFLKKTVKSTGTIIPDTLETQLNSHNQWGTSTHPTINEGHPPLEINLKLFFVSILFLFF